MFSSLLWGHATNDDIKNGSLKPCGAKPNCVCSYYPEDKAHYISPIEDENIVAVWQKLNEQLKSFNLSVVQKNENYIHATAQTPILRFIDDVEFLFLPEQNKIHLRSASRIGYSDLGANKKRLEEIKKQLQSLR